VATQLQLTNISIYVLWAFPAIPVKCQGSNLKLTQLLPSLSFAVCNANPTIPFYAKQPLNFYQHTTGDSNPV
jgi:hypothetical protein